MTLHLSAEYIVGFNNYYTKEARRNFITAALNHSGVIQWKIIPRDNPAQHLPSDFDVLEVWPHSSSTSKLIPV